MLTKKQFYLSEIIPYLRMSTRLEKLKKEVKNDKSNSELKSKYKILDEKLTKLGEKYLKRMGTADPKLEERYTRYKLSGYLLDINGELVNTRKTKTKSTKKRSTKKRSTKKRSTKKRSTKKRSTKKHI